MLHSLFILNLFSRAQSSGFSCQDMDLCCDVPWLPASDGISLSLLRRGERKGSLALPLLLALRPLTAITPKIICKPSLSTVHSLVPCPPMAGWPFSLLSNPFPLYFSPFFAFCLDFCYPFQRFQL